mmetsp:Transcript_38636/g.74060  ORF Transcript_38636/g.74060 Transcript_38636/m.74060 type:complete len:233 (+) Transcript_38636:2915-3613(+)
MAPMDCSISTSARLGRRWLSTFLVMSTHTIRPTTPSSFSATRARGVQFISSSVSSTLKPVSLRMRFTAPSAVILCHTTCSSCDRGSPDTCFSSSTPPTRHTPEMMRPSRTSLEGAAGCPAEDVGSLKGLKLSFAAAGTCFGWCLAMVRCTSSFTVSTATISCCTEDVSRVPALRVASTRVWSFLTRELYPSAMLAGKCLHSRRSCFRRACSSRSSSGSARTCALCCCCCCIP